MIRNALIIGLIFFGNISFATTWSGFGSDFSCDLIRTQDGGMILLGAYQNVDEDYYLIRFDSAFNQQWIQSFGDSGSYDLPLCISESTDHGFFVGGMEFLNYTATLIRTDFLGNKLWSKSYSNDQNSLFDILFVQQTKPDQLTIALRKSPLTGGTMMYLCYADTSGNLTDTIATINGGYGINNIQGGYFVTGTVDGPLPQYISLTRIDTTGGINFTKTYFDQNLNLDFRSYYSAPSGNGFLSSGTTNYFSANSTDYEFFLLQTDSAGDSLYSKHWGNYESELEHIIKSGNNFYVNGHINNGGIAGNLLIKLDSNADTVWTRDLGPDLYPYRLLDLTGGYYALAGDSTDSVSGYTDIWLIGFDSSGNFLNNATTRIFDPAVENNFNISPNPVIDFASFSIDEKNGKIFNAIILDNYGRLISRMELKSDELIDMRELRPGTYFIRMSDENGKMIGVQKILRQ